MPATYEQELLRALVVLQDYLPNIILIGGCVPYIYSRYVFETPPPPVLTKDLDMLVQNEISIEGSSIVDLLITAGYKGLFLKKSHAQYFKFEGDPETGFELEFLSPEPQTKHDETIVVQNGLRAQVLPWLEFFFSNNMEVRIRDEFEGERFDFGVRLPTPGAFVLNKIKTYLDPAGDADRKKDIYYLYYLLRYLPIEKETLLHQMQECAEPDEIQVLVSRLSPLFSDQWSPGTLDVAVQLVDSVTPPENVRLLVLAEFNEFIKMLLS
jgi:Nucleotidyltransferase